MPRTKNITEEQKTYISNGYNKNYNASIIADILGLSAVSVRKFWSRKNEIADLPPIIKISIYKNGSQNQKAYPSDSQNF